MRQVDIPIFVYGQTLGIGYEFTNVQIFAGTNSLGFTHRLNRLLLPPIYGYPPIATPGDIAQFDLPEYSLVWTNPAPGTYVLTAVGQRPSPVFTLPPRPLITVTSAPVTITIMPATPTPTNHVDIVSVIASDPVAVEGTNCWVTFGTTNDTPSWTNWPPVHWSLITNCGPKSATFTVRRFGDATDPLTVSYNLSGTASNTVDYSMLTNFVIIPAGEAEAQVTVVPVDNVVSNVLGKTVVLSLTTNTNSAYVIGLPARAEVVIFEGLPRPFAVFLPDRTFHLSASGPDGAWFRVDYSPDLLNWTAICTNQVVQGSIDFVDPDAVNNSSRFYRAVPQ